MSESHPFSFALDPTTESNTNIDGAVTSSEPAVTTKLDLDHSRTGLLNGKICTPTFTIPSRRGMPLNLSYQAIKEVLGKDTGYVMSLPIGDMSIPHENTESQTQKDRLSSHILKSITGFKTSKKDSEVKMPVSFRDFVGADNVDENVFLFLSYRDSFVSGMKKIPMNENEISSKKNCFVDGQIKLKPLAAGESVTNDNGISDSAKTVTTQIDCTPETGTNSDESLTVNVKAEAKSKNSRSDKQLRFISMEKTIHGRQKMEDPELIAAQFACHLQVNCVAQPGEEIDCNVGKNRSQRSGERCKSGLIRLETMNLKEEIDSVNTSSDSFPPMLASIQGGAYGLQRRIFSQFAKEKLLIRSTAASGYPFGGFVIGGLGYGESMNDRKNILKCIHEELTNNNTVTGSLNKNLQCQTASAPRFLSLGLGSPLEILQGCIVGGIDVFDITFPFEMANQGIALTFKTRMPEKLSDSESDSNKVPWALNLNNLDYEKDFSTIEPDFDDEYYEKIEGEVIRESYTRAYIHHLLSLNELLAAMNLTRHNLRKYREFFFQIRYHIKQNTLLQYRDWFINNHSYIQISNSDNTSNGTSESVTVLPGDVTNSGSKSYLNIDDSTELLPPGIQNQSGKIAEHGQKVSIKDGREKRKGHSEDGPIDTSKSVSGTNQNAKRQKMK